MFVRVNPIGRGPVMINVAFIVHLIEYGDTVENPIGLPPSDSESRRRGAGSFRIAASEVYLDQTDLANVLAAISAGPGLL